MKTTSSYESDKSTSKVKSKALAITATLIASAFLLSGCNHNSTDKSEENSILQDNVVMDQPLVYKGAPNLPAGWKVDKNNNESFKKDDGKCTAFLINDVVGGSSFKLGDDYRTKATLEGRVNADEDIKDFTTGTYTANIAGTNLNFLSYDYKGKIATPAKTNDPNVSFTLTPGRVHILLRAFGVKNNGEAESQPIYQSIGVKVNCKTNDQSNVATQAQDLLNAFVFTKASDASTSDDSSDSASPSDEASDTKSSSDNG